MADLGSTKYSEVDASNNNTPPDGWPAGMLPNAVEGAARANMGAAKRLYGKMNPIYTTAGTSTAYTLTSTGQAEAAYYTGQLYAFIVNATCGAAPTLNIDALGAANLRKFTGGSWVNLAASDILANQIVVARYNGTQFDVLLASFNLTDFVTLAGTNTFTGAQTFSAAVTANAAATFNGNTTISGGTNSFTGTHAGGSIASGVTGTTQSAADNSTKLATTAYADALAANGRIRAWARWATDGTISASGNIATIVKNSTANYTITYTAAVPANASIQLGYLDVSGSGGFRVTAQSTAAITVQFFNVAGSPNDFTAYYLTVTA